MEIQLQELIEQIKKDGVEAAEAQAEAILKSAKEEAERIISDAKALADKIMSDAKNENERTVKSGEDAIRQAGRNLLISFRESPIPNASGSHHPALSVCEFIGTRQPVHGFCILLIY